MRHQPVTYICHLEIGAEKPLARRETHSGEIVRDKFEVFLVPRRNEDQKTTVDAIVVLRCFKLSSFASGFRLLADNGYRDLMIKENALGL